jgi:hypothetical protein
VAPTPEVTVVSWQPDSTGSTEQCAVCLLPATSAVPRRNAPPLQVCGEHRAAFENRLAQLDIGATSQRPQSG